MWTDVPGVGLEDDLVESQAGLEAQPVEQGGDGHRWQGVDIGCGVAVGEQVEGRGLAADGGVVAGAAVADVDMDGSKLLANGIEDLLAEEGGMIDEAGIAARRAGMRRARLEGRTVGRRPLELDTTAILRDRSRGQSPRSAGPHLSRLPDHRPPRHPLFNANQPSLDPPCSKKP